MKPDAYLVEQLTPYLGRHTTRLAMKAFVPKALGRDADSMTWGDLEAVMAALRPLLRSALGAGPAQRLADAIAKEHP